MTKESCLKKGLVMAGIIAAVLSLAGCPKEAGGNGGGDNEFNIASVEGTWLYSGTNSNESIVITSNSITITKYNTSLSIVMFSGDIVKTLQKNSYKGIIAKDSSNKFRLYILKNIKKNTSIEVADFGDEDSLSLAEQNFEDATGSDGWAKLIQDNLTYYTYIRQ